MLDARSTSSPGRSEIGEIAPTPFEQVAGWAPELVSTLWRSGNIFSPPAVEQGLLGRSDHRIVRYTVYKTTEHVNSIIYSII